MASPRPMHGVSAPNSTIEMHNLTTNRLAVFSRAIQTHLLIVWDVPTPKNSFLLSQLFSWTLAGILLTTTLTVTGVSCRLGDYCFFNLKDSWASFWGPSLVFASITTFLTFGTAGYCLYVYVKSVYIAARPNSDLTAPSVGRPTAAAVWRRVRAVILLQWRPITIVVVLLLDLVTAIAVFVYTNTITGNAISHPESYTTWLLCLIVHPKNKDMCLSLVRDRNPWPATLQTPFVLLSLTGIVAFLVLSTSGMITGWYDLFRHLPRSTIAFIKRADDKGYTLYKRAYDHLHRGAKTTHSAAKSHWAFLTSIGPPAGLRIDVPILHLPTLPKLKLALPNFNRPSFNRKPKKSAGGITEPKRPRPLSGIKKSDISRPTNARLSIGPMVPGILSSLRQNELPGPIRIATSGKTLKMASRPSNDFVSSPLGPESQSQSQHGQDTNAQTDTPTETHASSPSRFSEVGLVPVTATPVRYSKEISSGVGAVGMTSGTDFDTPVSRRKGGSVRTSANGLLQHPGALAVGAAGSGAVAGAVARVGVSPLNFHPVVAESDTETETEMEVGNGGGEEEAVFEMDEDEDDEGAWSDAETERERPFDLGQSQGRVGEMDGDGMDREEDGEEDGEEEVDEVSEDDSLFYETSPSKMA